MDNSVISEFEAIAGQSYENSNPVFVHREFITQTAAQMIALIGKDDPRAVGIAALAAALSCPVEVRR